MRRDIIGEHYVGTRVVAANQVLLRTMFTYIRDAQTHLYEYTSVDISRRVDACTRARAHRCTTNCTGARVSTSIFQLCTLAGREIYDLLRNDVSGKFRFVHTLSLYTYNHFTD